MADIIRIKDRQDAVRRARSLQPAPIIAAKAEILFFTGIRQERLDPQASWTRVELPALPAPQGSDRRPG